MSIRMERLGSLLQKDLGEIIQRSYQPQGTFITISKVIMSPDLAIAKIYLSVYAPGRDEEVVYQYIDENVQEIRKKLAGLIKNQVRKIPELHFYADDTNEYVDNIDKLFKKVDDQRSESDPTDEEE